MTIRPPARRATARIGLCLALFLPTSVVGGCDSALPNAPADEERPGIHPRVVVTRQSSDTVEVQLHLVRVGVRQGISSYQGEIRFDSLHLKLVATAFPTSSVANWRAVDGGRAGFAAAMPGGLPDSVAATFRFYAARPATAGSVTVQMVEVTAATDDFRDLTNQLVSAN